MSFRIFPNNPSFLTAIDIVRHLGLPTYTSLPNIQSEGAIIYNSTLNQLYYSDGTTWISLGSGSVLPPALQSIASLSTTSNEMIYTIATNTYNTAPISSFGRTLVSSSNATIAQGVLNSIIGINVQPFSNTLTNFDTISTGALNDTLTYNTGAGSFSTSSLTPFARNLLDDTSASQMRTTIDTVQKPLTSTNNAIATFSGVGGDILQSSNVIISGSDISAINNITFTGLINSVNTTEFSQLANINGNTISPSAWTNMSLLDQDVSSTSTPTFSGASFNANVDMSSNRIVNLATPISGNDATNKSYVDSVASAGLTPLTQASYATATFLPDIPVYAEPNDTVQTLTSSAGAGVALVVDGANPSIGQRILVKNEADPRQNGVYDVSDDGAGLNPWQLTRSFDFNQDEIIANGPITQNTFIFITSGGTANSNTSWLLQNTITQIRPTAGGTNVVWVQFAGSQNIVPNDGLTQAGVDWNVDATARFTFTGVSPNRQLELSTVSVPFGGTGLTSLTANRVLIGNGVGAVDLTKVAPTGDFVGTTDIQGLTNKTLNSATNTVVADSIWDKIGSPVSISNTPSSLGQQLSITGLAPNIASWSNIASLNYSRLLIVANTGADFTSIKDAVDSARTNVPPLPSHIIGGIASLANPIQIYVSTGIYMEANPIIMGDGIFLTTYTERAVRASNVLIMPTTSITSPIIQLSSNCAVEGISVRGANGVGGVGFYVPPGSTDANITGCQVTDCDTGYHIAGPGVSYLQNNVAENISATEVCNIGVRITGGASVGAVIMIIRGDSITNTPMAIGYSIEGNNGATGSVLFGGSCTAVLCLTAVQIIGSGGIPANVIFSGSAILYSVITAIDVYTDATAELYGTAILNSIGLDVRLRASTSKFIGSGNKVRVDKVQYDVSTAQYIGQSLSETPERNLISVNGTLTSGSVIQGSDNFLGQGYNHTQGMTVLKTDLAEGSYTNITSIVSINDGLTTTMFPTGAVGDKLYIGGSFAQFPGIEVRLTVAMVPNTSGTVVWEYWNGSAWTLYRVMSTVADHTTMAQQVFASVGGCCIRFGDIVNPIAPINSSATFISSTSPWITSTATPAGWTQTTVNGIVSYWVRVRVITLLSTNPVVDKINLQANSVKIGLDGFTEFFGTARSAKRVGEISASNVNVRGTGSPDNVDVAIDDTLRIGMIENSFASGALDTVGWVFESYPDMDTSFPARFEWKWQGSTGVIGTTVRWLVAWGYSKDYEITTSTLSDVFTSASGPATAPTQQQVVFTQLVPALNKQIVSWVYLDISNVMAQNTNNSGDLIWIALQRASPDTFSSDANVISASLRYISWCNGKYVN